MAWLLTVVVTLIAFPCLSDSKARSAKVLPGQRPIIQEAKELTFGQWMNSSWTVPDTPYANIRAEIDGDLKRGVAPGVVLHGIEKKYPRTCDPASMFAYLYAAVTTLKYLDVGTNDYNLAYSIAMGSFYTILGSPSDFPPTYNFTRVAFIMSAVGVTASPPEVWRKLLTRDPKDQQVKDTLMYWLEYSLKPQDRALAHKIASERLTALPDDPISYSTLAELQFADAQWNKDVKYAKLAVISYRRAAALQKVGPGRQKYYLDRAALFEDLIRKNKWLN
jgi:hypothetical protein